MNATRSLATVALVLALMGAAWAEPVLVGDLRGIFGATCRVYRDGDHPGYVGVAVRMDGVLHVVALQRDQAVLLANTLEDAWESRMALSVGESRIAGQVASPSGNSVYVAVNRKGPGARPIVAVAAKDETLGLGCAFFDQAGQVRYLANLLRRTAR
jgi:hypothetical protein